MATKFYSTKTLERLATELLIWYQAKAGRPLTLPITDLSAKA